MIRKLMRRFEEQGSVAELSRTGRPPSARTEENIERVRASTEEEPEISTRRRPEELSLHRTSLRRILRRDLNMFPYKIQLAQELKPLDYQQRLNYAVLI